MPTQWSGTVQERLTRLEQSGRRCDGNSRYCTRAAVEIYGVYKADGHGKRVQGAELEQKKCCSYHRNQFLENGMWEVTSNRQIAQKPDRKPRYPAAVPRKPLEPRSQEG